MQLNSNFSFFQSQFQQTRGSRFNHRPPAFDFGSQFQTNQTLGGQSSGGFGGVDRLMSEFGPPPPPPGQMMQGLMDKFMQMMGMGGQERAGDQTINNSLDSLGLENTGSIQGDLQAIKDTFAENGNRPINPAPQGGDQTLNAMLDSLGLENTGSIEGDLQAITEAYENQQGTQKSGGKGGRKGAGGPPPEIQALLSSIGLSPTGSKEGDLAQAMNYFDNLEAQGTGNKASINAMRQNFISAFSAL